MADGSASDLCGKQKYSIVCYALLRKTWASFKLDRESQEEGTLPIHSLLKRTHPRQPEDRKKTAIELRRHAPCSGTLLSGVPRKVRAASLAAVYIIAVAYSQLCVLESRKKLLPAARGQSIPL